MAAPKKKPEGGDLTVTAPLVQLRVGNRIVHLFQGDIVPENADQESLDHLRGLGFLSDAQSDSDEK